MASSDSKSRLDERLLRAWEISNDQETPVFNLHDKDDSFPVTVKQIIPVSTQLFACVVGWADEDKKSVMPIVAIALCETQEGRLTHSQPVQSIRAVVADPEGHFVLLDPGTEGGFRFKETLPEPWN